MATGSVKWFSNQKGYGFIVPDEGGKDIFVHHSNIQMDGFRTLEEGQKVEYEVAEGRKGPEATNVRLPGGAAPAAAADQGGDDAGEPPA